MDAKPALDPHQNHLDRLQDSGYNNQEARFLYLAATHSGYFTRHQFLSFTHQTKGCLVHRFTTKLLTQHHAQATQYGHKTYVFKLTSRRIFDLIGKQNLRDHRSHNADFIRKRLLVLDFVLGRPDLQYLESQEEKLKFFHEQLGVPATPLPKQTDKTGGLDPSSNRFFKDRFPIFVSARIVHVSPHSFRHSYRAWLDELDTPVTVQQRAMRHGDIRVTMNYGDAVGDGLREASAKVAAKAIPQ